MKIGFISDAHGNPYSLRLCLERLSSMEVDKIVFLGDAAGYFPETNEVIEMLQAFSCTCLLGNHDAMLIEKVPVDPKKDNIYKITEARQNIKNEYISLLTAWLPFLVLHLDDMKKVLCVHGSPWDPTCGYVYPDADFRDFALLDFDYLIMGHTHRPFIHIQGQKKIINVGSCALPRDFGNKLCFGILNTKEHAFDNYRFPYDINQVIQRYKDSVHSSVIDCLNRTKE